MSKWFTEKVLPGLFLAMTLSVCTAAVGIWQTVQELSSKINTTEHRIKILESRLEQTVTRTEMLETLKRVEQQLQIVLLQSGIRQKVDLK